MRSKRLAAACSALAVLAGGLVTTAVLTAPPALADHCDPAAHSRTAQQPNGESQSSNDDAQPPSDGAQAPDGDGQPPNGGALAPPTPPEEAPPSEEAAPPEESAAPEGDERRRPAPSPTQEEPAPSESPEPSASPSPTRTNDDCADLGPFVEDFVDIRQVPSNGSANLAGRGGSFNSRCGTNSNGHNNPDNFIVAPGVRNGAHHLHDYVGNLSTDAFSTDQSLAAAGTTCRLNDRSTYFWPVLRNRKIDANVDDPDGNVGVVLRPRQAIMLFRSPGQRVTAMPRFLRMITGDAKAATNGGANARAQWSCTGFTNRLTTKYPLCPRGSQVVRILDFPSCWDGQNTDSANHRTHVLFPQGGRCPAGTRAIPQLRMILTYSVPSGPSYALDAFPEQKHNPITDHADFANVMPDRLMSFVVNCINRGRRC